MSNLRSTIESLASDFALSILTALRSASIDDLTDVSSTSGSRRSGAPGFKRTRSATPLMGDSGVHKRGRGGRLGRRTTTDIARMVDAIVSLLEKNSSGMRAEQIRGALGVQAKELPRPLADALAEGRISKAGQKRATTYFAGSASADSGVANGSRRGRKRSS
jgi:hypothetical protein